MIYRMTIHRPGEPESKLVQDAYPELKQLQDMVAGPNEERALIERVQLHLKDGEEVDYPEMIVNENGLALGLPYNEEATMLYWQTAQNNGHITGNPIVGTAIVFDNFKLR